jgi:AmiR/NasT family two-component response regulator
MERRRLTADQAFDVLARASQRSNRKLVELAEELTATGALPDGA